MNILVDYQVPALLAIISRSLQLVRLLLSKSVVLT